MPVSKAIRKTGSPLFVLQALRSSTYSSVATLSLLVFDKFGSRTTDTITTIYATVCMRFQAEEGLGAVGIVLCYQMLK